MSAQIYLTRRNLLTLLAKLDAKANGEDTQCTIVKYKNPGRKFVQTMPECRVTSVEDNSELEQSMKEVKIIAMEDDEFYLGQDRPAGIMHPREEAQLPKPCTGIGEMVEVLPEVLVWQVTHEKDS